MDLKCFHLTFVVIPIIRSFLKFCIYSDFVYICRNVCSLRATTTLELHLSVTQSWPVSDLKRCRVIFWVIFFWKKSTSYKLSNTVLHVITKFYDNTVYLAFWALHWLSPLNWACQDLSSVVKKKKKKKKVYFNLWLE